VNDVFATHERKLLGTRIGDVDGHVVQALREPEQRHECRVRLTGSKEVRDKGRGYEQLQDRAAGDADELADRREDDVAGFMNGEVDVVQQEERAGCAQVRRQVPGGQERERCANRVDRSETVQPITPRR